MKTINFLTSHFLPENTACTNRVVAYIKELEKIYKINVICLSEKGATPDRDIWKYSKNITVYYVEQYSFDGTNFIKRAFKEIQYIGQLINVSKKLHCDVTIATAPYMFMIPLVGFRLKGKKILDIRDLVWEYLEEQNLFKKFIKKILTIIMKEGIKRFDHITVTNEYEKNVLVENYGVNKVMVLPNGIDKKRYEQLSQLTFSKFEKDVVTYVGNIGLAQNLKTFIDAAFLLPNISFIVIGSGIEAKKIKNYTKEKSVENVIFTGKLQWEELEKYYQRSSILYAQLDEKYISAMPSKLYEYASVGLPIVYGGKGQAIDFVKKLENTKVVAPNDPIKLANAIKSLRDIKQVSIKNRELIYKHFLREGVGKKMNSIVNKIIEV